MEKLQRALEKARASRQGQTEAGPATQPRSSALRAGHPAPVAPSGNADVWDSLPRMNVDLKTLAKNRIIAQDGVAEAGSYDLLRTRLRDEVQRKKYKRIAITSPAPNAGKSTTLTNLAFALGRLPFQRTMVFDLDLRRPAMHRLLGQKPASDLGQVITGQVPLQDNVQRYGANLAFGLNRGPVSQSSELLQSHQMETFLSETEQAYKPDLMLFDMPPFLVVDDALGFLRHIDGVILVVEAEHTPPSQIEKIEERLVGLTNLVGVVLNKCNFPEDGDRSKYGYSYGYS